MVLNRCSGGGDGGGDAASDARVGCTSPGDCGGATPACFMPGASGMCVECVQSSDCPLGKPSCSAGHACGACTLDSECVGRTNAVGICEGGACLSVMDAAVVQPSLAADCGTRTGAPTLPYCSLRSAIDTDSRSIFYLKMGAISDRGEIDVNGKSVTIVGREGSQIASAQRDYVTARNGAQLTMRGIKLVDNQSGGLAAPDGTGLICQDQGTKCVVDNCAFVDNFGIAIRVTQARLEVSRTMFRKNLSGAISFDTFPTFSIENSFFIDNGRPNTTTINPRRIGAILVNNTGAGTTSVIRSNTFFNNHADSAGGAPTWSGTITCEVGAQVTVGNNIFYMNNPIRTGAPMSIMCGPLSSLTDDATVVGTNGNITGAPVFVDDSVSVRDLHIRMGSAARNMGNSMYAPSRDYDGDTRDTMPDIGADEFR